MARPKNKLVVLPDNTVVSIAPSQLKAYLSATADGVPTSLGGKSLGTVDLTLAAITQENAKAVLASMFPEEVATVEAPAMTAGTATATPAPVEAPASTETVASV